MILAPPARLGLALLSLTLMVPTTAAPAGPATPAPVAPTVAAPPPFALETVDTTGLAGTHVSLALDARGNPRIAYFDDSADDLRYASKRAGVWTAETADASGSVGQYTSIALDTAGNPRIAYYSVTGNDLKLAQKNGAIWSVETIEGPNAVGLYASLDLDQGGDPHVAYYDATLGDLHYAARSGAAWTIDIADAPGTVGLFASLALDALGNPRIAYFDDGGDNLKYASKAGGVWSSETVESNGDVGRYASLAIDVAGSAHIAYHDATGGDLKYAHRDGVGWTIEAVDTTGLQGLYASIALGVDGEPRIAYFDNTANDLKYAVRSASGWTLSGIDTPGIVGWFAALELDDQGNASIAYTDVTQTDLRFASTALQVASPAGGAVWPVGSEQTVRWTGIGPIDLSLSADGGATWLVLERALGGDARIVRVPHLPTRFARLRIERATPYAAAVSDSFFQIDASISLIDLTATKRVGEDAVRVAWRTEPAPPVIAGYVVERSAGSGGATDWTRLNGELLAASDYVDRGAPGGEIRYRLTAVNGLGVPYRLGETTLRAALPEGSRLLAYPNPARDDVRLLFRAQSLDGTGAARAEVEVRDLSGRRVRLLPLGRVRDGERAATWDGRDDSGERVASGVYIVELRADGLAPRRAKVTIAR